MNRRIPRQSARWILSRLFVSRLTRRLDVLANRCVHAIEYRASVHWSECTREWTSRKTWFVAKFKTKFPVRVWMRDGWMSGAHVFVMCQRADASARPDNCYYCYYYYYCYNYFNTIRCNNYSCYRKYREPCNEGELGFLADYRGPRRNDSETNGRFPLS